MTPRVAVGPMGKAEMGFGGQYHCIRCYVCSHWHEVKKVDHYWQSVDAAGQSLGAREGARE